MVRICQKINDEPMFDNFMITCILINSVFMALPYQGMSSEYEAVLDLAELVFTIVFVVEFAIKIIALGATYFAESTNIFDFIIVASSLVAVMMQGSGINASALRVFRVFRVGRTLRALKENEDIQQVLRASIGSGTAFLNNFTFLCFLLIMFGLCGMNFYGNLLPTMRPNFDNFGVATTLFVLLTDQCQAWRHLHSFNS